MSIGNINVSINNMVSLPRKKIKLVLVKTKSNTATERCLQESRQFFRHVKAEKVYEHCLCLREGSQAAYCCLSSVLFFLVPQLQRRTCF